MRRKLLTVIGALFLLTLGSLGGWWFFLPQGDSWLRAFEILFKKDPVLYLPLIDADEFLASVEFLGRVERNLIETNFAYDTQRSAFFKEKTDFRLWPMRFLFSLAEADRASEAFFAKPTRWRAWKALREAKRAQTAYLGDAEGLRETYRILSERMGLFGTRVRYSLDFDGNNFVTPEVVASDLEVLLRNSQALGKEIALRYACLFLGRCEEPKSAVIVAEEELPRDPRQFLPERFLKPSFRTTVTESAGPYWVPSQCFLNREDGKETLSAFFLRKERWGTLPEAFGAKLANEGYYFELPSRAPSTSSLPFFLQTLKDAGLRYAQTGPTTPHRCADLSYYPKLATVSFVSETVKKNSGFFQTLNAFLPAAREVAAKEQELLLDSAPSFESIVALAASYEEALGDPDITDMLGGKRSDVEKVVTASQFLIADYPRIINLIAVTNLFLDLLSREEKSADLEYLFVTRSNYSILFLPFSPVVWRISEKPRYHISRLEWERETKRFLEAYGADPSLKSLFEGSRRLSEGASIRKFSQLKKTVSEEELWFSERMTYEINKELFKKAEAALK